MQNLDELRGENELLRNCISRLTAASLQISASLGLDTVLREIVESARELAGADCGVITTVDASGQVEDFVSSGFTTEEHQQSADWPAGLRLFGHLRDLPGPIRLRGLPGYVGSLGISSHLTWMKTFQVTPMSHRGVHVGSFFLARKEGSREFTREDEGILVLFGSQAAAAIAGPALWAVW
ncbi:MAG: GAF domain-containing protein [Acidobacteriota bacterium]|nr:GAF domain-containing protein [Acidobacteriota bacterium]